MFVDCDLSVGCPTPGCPLAGYPLRLLEFLHMYWFELQAAYAGAFLPVRGFFVPRLFQVFDLCASLFTVIVFIVGGYSLLLHLHTLWLRHRLLRNIGADELARLESQQ